MAVKYRISCMSSERGWGREYWNEDYDTIEEAKRRIHEINGKNTAPIAPIEAIEVPLVPQGYI